MDEGKSPSRERFGVMALKLSELWNGQLLDQFWKEDQLYSIFFRHDSEYQQPSYVTIDENENRITKVSLIFREAYQVNGESTW